jgi:hypothetical protein
LSPQDTVHTVTLYHTRPAAGNNPYATWEQNVAKSTVTLSNGTQTVKLIPDSFLTGVFKISAKNFKVESGKTYYLSVNTFDGKKAEANCTIPSSVVDTTSISYQLVSGSILEYEYELSYIVERYSQSSQLLCSLYDF